jgi:hypothetical protein
MPSLVICRRHDQPLFLTARIFDCARGQRRFPRYAQMATDY